MNVNFIKKKTNLFSLAILPVDCQRLPIQMSNSLYCSNYILKYLYIKDFVQASKYLKIGTCPASQNLLAYMGKFNFH